MKIKPIGDHIIIEPLKGDEKSKGGIFLPQSAEKERPEQGKVVFVGPGKMTKSGKYVPMQIKKGDTVIFTKYGPTEIKINGKEYLVASQDDVLAIIEN
ncbi:MAG: co-chaperone GroES [Candidatus Pacebacteria bacterium]|nr:co-chaperone GroES [Candidatus Paceibacterota bacterium]